MSYGFVSTVSTIVLVVSVGYLAWRLVRQFVIQLRSYGHLPFGDVDVAEPATEEVDRARGAMLGVAIGDALGMPRESLPVWLSNLRFGRDPGFSRGVFRMMRRRGTISDDTQLTVATARAIDDEGRYRDEVFLRLLAEWLPRAIGAGRATRRAARGWAKGRDERDRESEGNGAAMRVVPLAITYVGDEAKLVDAVRSNARATHPSIEAVVGAESMARIVTFCLQTRESLGDVDWVDVALSRSTSDDVEDWRRRLKDAVEAAHSGAVLSRVGTTGWVRHTVPAVLFVLVAHGRDVEAGLRAIFQAGGDVDTIAALYLACVGARYGTGVFDTEWIDGVQGGPVMVEQADRLLEQRSL